MERTRGSGQPSFPTQPEEGLSPLRLADIAVFGLILAFGALQFFYYERAADFLHEDVFYADAARSLVQHGFYGIDGHPETNQPPGFPAILAMLFLVGGYSHSLFQRAMAVFETLGFLASYELLRRKAPRIVAAAICLLLISSGTYFSFATRSVSPSSPYLFTTMSALLVAEQLETAASPRSRFAWGALLTALCAASLMIASAAVALLAAMGIRIGITFVRNRRLAAARVRALLPVLLFGIAVQGLWMHRQPAPLEWSVPGYPRSYLSQLMLKNGNDPELGMATLREIPVRVVHNALDDTGLLGQVLLHRGIDEAWMSAAVVGPLLLILLGWGYSVWPSGGGLHDWYFAAYEFIYLLWPWNVETRFFLPIAPLACFYLWSGVRAVGFLARNKPRLLGAAWLPASVVLAIGAWYWTQGSGIARHMLRGGLQGEISFLTWLLSAIVAALMAWASSAWLARTFLWLQCFSHRQGALRITPMRVSQLLVGVAAIGLIITGLEQQIALGRDNMNLNSVVNSVPADAEAGMWIASHTDSNAVVMARLVPTDYHYSGRRVVWFPPSSNPQLLIEGIRRLKVDYVVVVHRQYSYYLPPDDDCFAPLLAAYPEAFHLAIQTPEFRIFLVRRPRQLSPRVRSTVLERDRGLPRVERLGQSVRGR